MGLISAKFMVIPPRHSRALRLLQEQKDRDLLGGIGVGALCEEDDVLTLEQIVQPLQERGLIEDLTQTELGDGGRFFVRITRLGEFCHDIGYMLRETRKLTILEMAEMSGQTRPRITTPGTIERLAKHDTDEEKEAIA